LSRSAATRTGSRTLGSLLDSNAAEVFSAVHQANRGWAGRHAFHHRRWSDPQRRAAGGALLPSARAIKGSTRAYLRIPTATSPLRSQSRRTTTSCSETTAEPLLTPASGALSRTMDRRKVRGQPPPNSITSSHRLLRWANCGGGARIGIDHHTSADSLSAFSPEASSSQYATLIERDGGQQSAGRLNRSTHGWLASP